VARLIRLRPSCYSDPWVRLPQYVMHIAPVSKRVYSFTLLVFWDYDCFQKNRQPIEYVILFLSNSFIIRFEPTTFLFGEGILSIRLYRQSNLDGMHYSLII